MGGVLLYNRRLPCENVCMLTSITLHLSSSERSRVLSEAFSVVIQASITDQLTVVIVVIFQGCTATKNIH